MKRHSEWAAFSLLSAALMLPVQCRAGVTFITHGLNGNVDGWVTGMANQIPNYARFRGTNFTSYKAYFYSSGGSYYLAALRDAGSPPTAPESGEIIVKFDWSQLADGNSYNTYQVAAAAVPALLSTNFIPELGGHALAEMPLHLVGHSRGGSLICEISRWLGTNGIWVDHLTTLDPHPLNNDGFTFDSFLYSAVDAPAHTYASVLFHDNCWQDISSLVYGEPVAGAYVRQLTSPSGGYTGTTGPHSNVHLWYHGTIDPRVPTSDTEASITSTQRTNWWVTSEAQGTNAGFLYSLIGSGNRLGTNQPLGSGHPAIRDGYNQTWDLGAGSLGNRTALATNNGAWPSLIKFDRTQTNLVVVQGQSTLVRFYYQWARPTNTTATISVYLDNDLNPLNSNQTFLTQITVPGTGAPGFIGSAALSVPLSATNTTPGWHALLAVIRGGGQTRYLYAPQPVQIISNAPPVMNLAMTGPEQLQISVSGTIGQTIVLQTSSDLLNWQPLATNTLTSAMWIYTNNMPLPKLFFRATLTQ